MVHAHPPHVVALTLAGEEFSMPHDLVLSGGRVLDPETGLDRRCDVGVDGRFVTAVGDALDDLPTPQRRAM